MTIPRLILYIFYSYYGVLSFESCALWILNFWPRASSGDDDPISRDTRNFNDPALRLVEMIIMEGMGKYGSQGDLGEIRKL